MKTTHQTKQTKEKENTANSGSFGNIIITLIKFSLPLILSGVLQQLYNWADAFIVGNAEGELALAAVGSTTTAVNFYVTAITGFTLGLNIFFAQKYGSGETERIPRILAVFLFFLGGIILVLSALGMWLAAPLLELLRTTPDTITMAESYLRIVLAGMPFLAVYNVYSAALRGIGDSRAPFYAVLLSSAVNVALDIVFVVFLGLSVAGAAMATVFSQAAMTVFLVCYSIRKYRVLRFRVRDGLFRRSDRGLLAAGCRLAIPPMIQSNITSAGNLILQNFMNGFGTQTVAAITTAYRIDTIVLLPIINLGSGISTLTAQKYGAGETKSAGRILSAGAIVMAGVSLLLTLLVIPTGGRLIALFGAGEEAVSIGENFFLRIASFYVIYGLATAVRGYVEGLGDVLYSSAAGIASLLFRIGASYAAVSVFANMVIAYAEAFSWVLLLILYLIRLAMLKRRTAEKKREFLS